MLFFFFNDTATPEIYTLSLHGALPIFGDQPVDFTRVDQARAEPARGLGSARHPQAQAVLPRTARVRSEEHTSELQSHSDLVCRLLLEKKNTPAQKTPST